MSTDQVLQNKDTAIAEGVDPQETQFRLKRPLFAVAVIVLAMLLALLVCYPPWPGSWRQDAVAEYFDVILHIDTEGRIDLNSADSAALQSLPGIGAGRADAILAYRAACGPFSSVDELVLVEGIGEKTLEELRAYVTVLPPREQNE